VFIAIDDDQTQRIQNRWENWITDVPLIVIDSPYRELMHPLVDYIDTQAAKNEPGDIITVVVPEFVPRRWWHNFLHNQNATWLHFALRHIPGVVVVNVPYQVE